jgi:hypothetical protein
VRRDCRVHFKPCHENTHNTSIRQRLAASLFHEHLSRFDRVWLHNSPDSNETELSEGLGNGKSGGE